MERSSTSGSSGSAQVSSPVAVPPPTIFVQAEPHTFRDLVQKHTGAPAGVDAPDKLPVTAPPPPPARSPAVAPRRAAFKLQERRPSVRKLEIKLGLTSLHHHHPVQPSPRSPPSTPGQQQYLQQLVAAAGGAKAAASFPSPVTPLVSGPVFSPPGASEEERAIAEKGFYLHPSPRGTPRGSDPPELLPLFPLTSPKLASRQPSSGDSATDREAERKQL